MALQNAYNFQCNNFWDSGLVPCSGGSIRRNGKLMDQVCFVYTALFILMESSKNHVLNPQPVLKYRIQLEKCKRYHDSEITNKPVLQLFPTIREWNSLSLSNSLPEDQINSSILTSFKSHLNQSSVIIPKFYSPGDRRTKSSFLNNDLSEKSDRLAFVPTRQC